MNISLLGRLSLFGILAALGLCFGMDRVMSQTPPPLPAPNPAQADEGIEVLTRGPIHEAFAETVLFNPEPGVVAPKAPPEAIEEVPPDERPEGDNVAWIPGYWTWDDERSDFLWISGIWRALPPGRQWVPGYWSQTAEGYQWTSGYWADAKVEEVEYLPEPPATIEAGPNIVAPSPDVVWLPGCWVWRGNRYAWRPGFWTAAQPNWIWVPARYVWTPRGYVYVGGYWDYVVARRGVLFAPVYFRPSVYARRGFYYSPLVTINLGVFSDCLFLRPRYHHYYFGDYYAVGYRGAGFYPWFSVHAGRFAYDPFYAHSHWMHRSDPGWARGHEVEFKYRLEHKDARPPHTWAMQQQMLKRPPPAGVKHSVVGVSLNELKKKHDGPVRLKTVNAAELQHFKQQGKDVAKFRDERYKLDTASKGLGPGPKSKDFKPGKVKLPGSPVVAKPKFDGKPKIDVGKKDFPSHKVDFGKKDFPSRKGDIDKKDLRLHKGDVDKKALPPPRIDAGKKDFPNRKADTGKKIIPPPKGDAEPKSGFKKFSDQPSRKTPPKLERPASELKKAPPKMERPATQRQAPAKNVEQPSSFRRDGDFSGSKQRGNDQEFNKNQDRRGNRR